MRRRTTIAMTLAFIVLMAIGLRSGHLVLAQSATEESQDAGLDVRLARAHVSLARLDLQRVLAANRKLPGAFSDEFIDKLKLHVALDEASLEQRLQGTAADAQEEFIRAAEAALKLAEADLKRALIIRESSATAENHLNVDRARIVKEIAELDLENARTLQPEESAVAHLQAQIDRLRHHILDLQMQH